MMNIYTVKILNGEDEPSTFNVKARNLRQVLQHIVLHEDVDVGDTLIVVLNKDNS